MRYRIPIYFASVLIVAGAILAAYFFTMRYHVSVNSLSFYRGVASEVKSVIRVLQFGEETYGAAEFKELDCDVYASFYTSVTSHVEDLKDPHFFITEEHAAEAQEVLDEAIEILEAYKDRYGEKDCGSGNIIIGPPL